MEWFLLLGIFWKPIYLFSMWGYYSYKKDSVNATVQEEKASVWFKALGSLLTP